MASSSRTFLLMSLVSATLACSEKTHAVSVLSDDFDGPGFDAGLVDVNGTYQLAGGQSFNTGIRSYVRTVDGDFAISDFQADLIYTIDGGSTGQGGVFFGIGSAERDEGFFGEPDASFYVVDHPDDFANYSPESGIGIRVNASGGGNVNDLASLPAPDGLTFARISKINDQITFSYDLAYDGVSFSPDQSFTTTLSSNAPFLANNSSFLFFGSESSTTRFESLDVIPEPSTAVISLIAFGAAIVRRRRA